MVCSLQNPDPPHAIAPSPLPRARHDGRRCTPAHIFTWLASCSPTSSWPLHARLRRRNLGRSRCVWPVATKSAAPMKGLTLDSAPEATHAWNASCLPSRRRRVTALPGWVSAALGCCCRFSLSWQLCAVCLLPAETFFVMPYVTSTRLRIVPACAGAFCKAFILGIDQGNRPAENGRPSCRRPVCGCSVAAAQFAGGVRLGGVCQGVLWRFRHF